MRSPSCFPFLERLSFTPLSRRKEKPTKLIFHLQECFQVEESVYHFASSTRGLDLPALLDTQPVPMQFVSVGKRVALDHNADEGSLQEDQWQGLPSLEELAASLSLSSDIHYSSCVGLI